MVAYLNKEDMVRKLHDCVVLYDKRPCFLKVAADDPLNVVSLSSIVVPGDTRPALTRLKVNVATDEKFSTRYPALGYVNEGIQTFSVRRAPVRRNKAGLHEENLIISAVSGADGVRYPGYSSRSVAEMLMNKYPTVQNAVDSILRMGYVSRAFTKTMYVSRVGKYDVGLFVSGRLVGTYDNSHEAFRISSSLRDFSYVISSLRNNKVPTC